MGFRILARQVFLLKHPMVHIDDCVQDCNNSFANTLDILGRLICPEGRVSSLNKCNPIQYTRYTAVLLSATIT